MYEENRRPSLADFLIKIILVIIFILFTVWLLSLSNKELTNNLSGSLNVLTDRIFAENVDRMKEVGKSYFTTERLPQKIGEVKTLTLAKMYDENLILEVKDKYGNSCSAKNSYVSVEKFADEYRMKVYLECGEESDFIIVIMGCYDYCDTAICEKKEEKIVTPTKSITEYEYRLTKDGKWTEWGPFSEWSKTSVTKTDYREIETKVVKEPYTYDVTDTKVEYVSFNLSCPSGYTSNGSKCYKNESSTSYVDMGTCPATYNGMSFVSQTGDVCNYGKSTTTSPSCPSVAGYTLASRNGMTCTYTKTNTQTSSPVCDPKYGDGTYQSISNFTCYYKAVEEGEYCEQVAYQIQKPIYCAGNVCGFYYDTAYKPVCTPYSTEKTTSKSAYCKEGYTNINGICTLTKTDTKTTSAVCPLGYTIVGSTCSSSSNSTKVLSCPSGYTKTNDNRCYKNTTSTSYKDIVKTCPADYKATSDNTKCYKEVKVTRTVTEDRNVTYYRYRIREYIGGSTDYKWSTSKNDKSLLNAGYVLTGRTRNGGK